MVSQMRREQLLKANPHYSYQPKENYNWIDRSLNFSCPMLMRMGLKLLPILVLQAYFDLDAQTNQRKVNGAAINISGRQRMLSQRLALMALRLVHAQDISLQKELRQELLAMIALMEKSHNGLVKGDESLNLSGQLSATIEKMYFQSPVELDCRVQEYLQAARKVALTPNHDLIHSHPQLQHLLKASEKELLESLDAVVSQYQKEEESEELAIDLYQAKLYQDSCTATAVAQAKAAQLKETLKQLTTAQTQLVQAERMSSLGQLVAGIAHEVNNPLSFIRGNLDHAQDYTQDLLQIISLYQQHNPNPHLEITQAIENIELDYLQKDLPELFKSMQLGTERIQSIVLSLRNFSRLDESGIKSVDLHEGIDSTLVILQHRLKSKNPGQEIKIIKDYSDLPRIECYPMEINQVFMNIVNNAIDALEISQSQNKDSPLWLEISTRLSNSNTVILRFADNGTGIARDIKDKIFNPFFTTKLSRKGTGLGLSISYQVIVERHQGKLDCFSKSGEGAEFIIELPIRQEESTPD